MLAPHTYEQRSINQRVGGILEFAPETHEKQSWHTAGLSDGIVGALTLAASSWSQL